METMNGPEVQSFLARDWRLIEQAKSAQWMAQKTAMSPSAAIELASELLQYARTLRPDWPNSAERQADLDSHVRVAGMLQRVAQDRAR
jgi:hypothetical protein